MTNLPPIAVLLGGPSAEHDVSIVSGTAIAEALAEWLREADFGAVSVFHRELDRA